MFYTNNESGKVVQYIKTTGRNGGTFLFVQIANGKLYKLSQAKFNAKYTAV